MISSANLPPYNRFDKVPCHALQCGISPSDTDLMGLIHHSASPLRDLEFHNNNNHIKENIQIPDSTGSRYSLESSVSALSQDSFRNSDNSVTWSNEKLSNKSSVDSNLSDNDVKGLYIEQTSPPAYNGRHEAMANAVPSRTNLPKKSKAAQQSVAELLKEAVSIQKPFGKYMQLLAAGSCKQSLTSST